MYFEQYFISGLGCASYLVGDEGTAVAAVIDPDRDVRKYLDTAAAYGLSITHIIETHLHADHVSGNTELRARTGANIYIHEQAAVPFDHVPLQDGDVVDLGTVRIDVSHTPGHTPDSVTLLVTDMARGKEPWMALTGDTLFVGDIGRPDLVGADAARGLASRMYDTLQHKILPLSDGVMIFPGHGAGSLCGKALAPVRSSSMGFERHNNPALFPLAREAFIEFAVAGLPEQPANAARIKGANRRGPSVLGEITPVAITVEESLDTFRSGAQLLDLRPKEIYRLEHVAGSVQLDLDDQLSNRAGFVLHPDAPIVLQLGDPEAPDVPARYRQAIYALARIGLERVAGYLSEGLDVWKAYGLPVASGDLREITISEFKSLLDGPEAGRPAVIDVREPWEFAQGHVPGARLIPLGRLGEHLQELDPERPVALICQTGSRSRSAAALLGSRGYTTVYNVTDGTQGWMRSGLPLERPGEPICGD